MRLLSCSIVLTSNDMILAGKTYVGSDSWHVSEKRERMARRAYPAALSFVRLQFIPKAQRKSPRIVISGGIPELPSDPAVRICPSRIQAVEKVPHVSIERQRHQVPESELPGKLEVHRAVRCQPCIIREKGLSRVLRRIPVLRREIGVRPAGVVRPDRVADDLQWKLRVDHQLDRMKLVPAQRIGLVQHRKSPLLQVDSLIGIIAHPLC